MTKSNLWVADPRQVTLDSGHPWPSPFGQTASVQIRSCRICLCLSKEKSPKEKTPRSRRRLPALLAGIGARLTRRALNNAPRARSKVSRIPRFRLRCSAAATGPENPIAWRCAFFQPRMAHPSPVRLWASARRGADRDVCACPAATGCRVGAARDPKPRRRGSLCAIRGVLSLVSFFARAKKETRPRCGEPQLIRRRRRLDM